MSSPSRTRLPRVALRIAASVAVAGALAASAPAPARASAPLFSEFSTPTAGAYPREIVLGPDGNYWFTENESGNVVNTGHAIGRITPAGVITEFPLPAGAAPDGITVGPDGALWFTEHPLSRIGRITTAGVVTQFATPHGADGITTGPDGNLWFVEFNDSIIGRMTTAGAVTEFPMPTNDAPGRITAGPDGNLWYTVFVTPFYAAGGNRIDRITPSGVITEFTLPTPNNAPYDITTGPDGNLWFTEAFSQKIGKITPTGTVTEYPVPGNSAYVRSAADGTLWFTDFYVDALARISTSGKVLDHITLPSSPADPGGLVVAPDGRSVWLLERRASKVAHYVGPGATVTAVSPAAGPVAGGTAVTITGTEFSGSGFTTSSVQFGATVVTATPCPATPVAPCFTVNSPTSITAVTPPGGVGTVDITVTSGGIPTPTSAADRYTFAAAPTVTTASADSSGAQVVVAGSGFSGLTAVDVAGTHVTAQGCPAQPAGPCFTVVSDQQVVVRLTAALAPGTFQVAVTGPGGSSAAVAFAVAAAVTPAPPPSVPAAPAAPVPAVAPVPQTGADPLGPGVAGVLLIGLGLATLHRGRRRRYAQPTTVTDQPGD